MTRPHLDHAEHQGNAWHWIYGVWHRWNNTRAEWEPSEPPPPEAEFFNYRERILEVPHG
jgi:hypothetical protein